MTSPPTNLPLGPMDRHGAPSTGAPASVDHNTGGRSCDVAGVLHGTLLPKLYGLESTRETAGGLILFRRSLTAPPWLLTSYS